MAETARTAGPMRIRTFTCLDCGHRSASWAAFRDHRRRCRGIVPSDRAPAESDGGAHGDPPDVT